MPDLTIYQWILGALAAALTGFSKTGIPGTGILVVPVMAAIFGGRESVGALLPMLIFADLFALARYRQHAQWDKLWQLIPWVLAGFVIGALLLWKLADYEGSKDLLGPIIGVLVLGMLAVHLARAKLGDRLTPRSRTGAAATGVLAGFSTMVSNAAGPVMGIYLAAMGMSKNQFMGTFAWYFFIFNTTKLPVYIGITLMAPDKPIITASSLAFNAAMAPFIGLGALSGYWLLPRIPQRLFDEAILTLAAIAALKLIF